jgi:hypothetical protein
MTTPQFIAWLDGKMVGYEGKLIPPPDVIEAELDDRIEDKIRAEVSERILRAAGFEDQVAATIAVVKKPTATALANGTRELLAQEPDREWRDYVKGIVAHLETHEGD